MNQRKAKHNQPPLRGLAAWGISAVTFGGTVALSAWLSQRFPDFDPLPLFWILLAAFAAACAVNRISAHFFARKHFGMPHEEMNAYMARHDKACREDPEAVMKQYSDMATVPVFLLGVYVLLTLSMIVTGAMCLRMEAGGLGHFIAYILGVPGGFLLLLMPIYRIVVTIPLGLKRDFLTPRENLPLLYAMAKRAADTAGVKGDIQFEITTAHECDVNRFGRTYVVFLGTRLMAVLTPEEMEQALVMAFSSFSRRRINRQVVFRYCLGLLGSSNVRPATFAFDLFFSYADASLEWTYALYSHAVKRVLTNEGYERVRSHGDVTAAMGVLMKEAFWSYYTFEFPHFMPQSFYETPLPSPHYEQDVCRNFRLACRRRSNAWLSMLGAEMEDVLFPTDLPFRYERRVLAPQGIICPPLLLPDEESPYGAEVTRLIAAIDQRSMGFTNLGEYEKQRKQQYLEPMQIVEEYEQNPTGYSTPELSPVINGYRDIGKFDRAEAVCDEILEREHNPFAMAHALYFKGMCMIHRYETEGIDHIYRAIDLNKNYMKDGFEMVGEYCVLRGLSDEYAAFRRRAEIQVSAHAYNQEGACSLTVMDRLEPEEGLGDMLPDILGYMERVADGSIREIYLVRKIISEDFFTSAFVINFDYGVSDEQMRRVYSAIFNYLDAYPVDWQFSLFLYNRETERAVMRVNGSRVWSKKE